MNEEEVLLNVLNRKGSENKKYKIEELCKITKIPDERIIKIIKKLKKEGKIYIDSKHLISSFPPHLIVGKIKINNNGNGSIVYKDKKYRLKKVNQYGILNGDIIIARPTDIFETGMNLLKFEAIVERENGIVIGEVQEKYGQKYIIDINNRIIGKINIPQNDLIKYVNGDRLQLKIGLEKTDNNYNGEVIKLIGHKDDPDLKVKSLLSKYELKIGFSEEAIKEAQEANQKGITPEHLKGRLDLRKFSNISIDPSTCKDRDDSFFIERLENGHKKVYINIIDIIPWVHPGTAMWKEAEEKNFSAYLYETSEPMLPRPITNELGSINENVDRLTESLIIEFDENNEVIDFHLTPSIVNTKKNCYYEDVNKLLEENIIVPGYEEIKEDIIDLNTIAESLYKNMLRRGLLDFPTKEKEYKRDEKGNIIDIIDKKMGKGEKMVETFMLLANQLIPDLVYLPAPFRNHAEPESNIINSIMDDLKQYDIKVYVGRNLDIQHKIQMILQQINNHPLEATISEEIIKKLELAYYSPNNIGHFGLAIERYLQWTSPDRRFNDLLLHYIIKQQRKIEEENLSQEEIDAKYDEIYAYLNKTCETISITERKIEEAERDSYYEAIREYKNKTKGIFPAQVIFLNQNLVMLKTADGKEGPLRLGNLFKYDNKKNAFINTHYKYRLHLGSKVTVKLSNYAEEQLSFEIPKSEAKRLSLILK